MNPSRPDYQSYLLRLWRDGPQYPWRASLQSTATEQIYHFPNVEAMLAFLLARQEAGEDGGAGRHEPRPL